MTSFPRAALLWFPAFLLLFSPASSELFRDWQIIGPGGGGALFHPTISSADPDRVMVASDMTGAYISAHGGHAWSMFNLRGEVRFLAFDPHNPDVIYAKSIGLWRSADFGRTWALIYPDPRKITGIAITDDDGSERILTSGDAGTVVALAIDPDNSDLLYAIVGHGKFQELSTSTDSGKSWKAISELPIKAHMIYVDPGSPKADRRLYFIAKNSVLRHEHGHWQQQPSPPGVDQFADSALAFPQGKGGPAIYAASGNNISVSDDGGMSWRTSPLPGSGARIRAIATSLHHPETAYASFADLSAGLSGGTYSGVAKTSDSGHSWQIVWKDTSKLSDNVNDAWVSKYLGAGYAENPLNLAVAPSDPNVVYSTDFGRIMRSTDGGKSWQALYSTGQPDGSFTGRGLEATSCYGIHFDPFDKNRVFISYTDIGLFRSDNDGASWERSVRGAPRAWLNTTYWVVFDPVVRGRMWAVMSNTHDLPRAKMWAHRNPSSYKGGVVVSDNGGEDWRQSGEGMPQTAATHIVLDPSSPPDTRVLYVAAFGRGVYKSVDGGKNWALKNNGILQTDPLAWRLARDSAGVLYLVVVRRSEDGSIGNEKDGALYRSRDGAEHWTRLPLPAGVNGPNGLAIDSRNPARLYLAAWGRNTNPRAQGGGVYLSNDAGTSWKNVLSQDQHIYDVTIEPGDPKIVYAAGFESSAWRSSDAGLHWTRIRGFNFKWGHRVTPDPLDPNKIYITTFGSSVWHGPAQGSNTPDAILTPPVAYGRK